VDATPTTLLDLAGAADEQELAARWPVGRIRWEHGDYDEQGAAVIAAHLNSVLTFTDVVSTVGRGTDRHPVLAVAADVHVDVARDPTGPIGVVHRHLPDFSLRLVTTDGNHPARLSWTRYDDGTSEWQVLALPVQLDPPVDLLSSPDGSDHHVDFDAMHPDSLGVRLAPADSAGGRTSLTFFVTLRMTRDGEFLIDPTVPLSVGRCVFMSLPCRAVHDIGLFPDVAAAFRPAHLRELPIGWTESAAQSVLAGRTGADQGLVTVRTIELDPENDGVRELYDLLGSNAGPLAQPLEVPLEDAALAFDAEGGFPTPAYPVYGYSGIRRAVDDDTAAAEPFDHTLAPVVVPLRDLVFVHVHRCLVGLTHELILNFDLAVTRTAGSADVRAVTVSLTQDRVVLVGYVPPEPVSLFRLGSARMSLLASRVGLRLGALVGTEPVWQVWKWLDLLFDVGIVSQGSDDGDTVAFRTRSGGKLDLVLRDVGWKDGAPSATAWIPDGVEMQVLGARGFHIDEIGLATTTAGVSYLRLSASYQVGGRREPSDRLGAQQYPSGNGIWVRGLRIRMQGPDSTDAPDLTVEGIVISLRGSDGSELEGGGWLRDEIVGGRRVRELGFGIRIVRPAGATEFVFSGTLVKGSVEQADRRTEYLLAAVTLGPIPLGTFTVLRGSVLVARNFVPTLPAPTGIEQNLRLFQWYRAQPAGLELPPGRMLGAWEPHPDSWVVGAGLRFIVSSSSVIKLDAFALWLSTPETWSLLVGLELRFKDNRDPIGWFAVEYDDASGRWAATGGVAIGPADVLDVADPDDLPIVAELTGSLYVSNEPRTIALGHIEDVDSWLQVTARFEAFDLALRLGFCYYNYDGQPPVNALGIVATGRGALKIPRLTELRFMLELAILLGSFASEGRSAGIRTSISAALEVKVWRMRFGVRAHIEIEHIRPRPDGGTATLAFTIETPWWLPNLHISHTTTFGGEPEIGTADVLALPLRGAQALGLATGSAIDLATPLPAGAADAGRAYTLDELAQLGPPAIGDDVVDALVPVPVDSEIAIDFAATVTNGMGVGETTPPDSSRQENGELWADYEVIELGVSRRARYGPDAGVWSTLLAPEDTSTTTVDPVTDTVDELVAKFAPELSVRWDRDLVRAGGLDARRLVLNAATPFTLMTANPIADDAMLHDPGATCCGRVQTPPWVVLDFETRPVGVRLPRLTPFPGDAAHVGWHGVRPPVVVDDASTRLVRIPLTGRVGTTLATVRFDRPAVRVGARLRWSRPAETALIARLELHRGLEIVAVNEVVLDAQQEADVEVHDGTGGDQLVVRLVGDSGPMALPILYVDALGYIGRAELLGWLLGIVRCEHGGTLATGTLAWLPNHDYAVQVICTTTVGHERVGSASVPVRQTALFRTRGWPGLNSSATPGGDLAPFVETAYPARPDRLLYRDEPILLVMNERFTPLAPAIDAPPTAPPERRQLLEWTMLVDRVGAGDDGDVATYPSPDWLSAHRQQPGPIGPIGARLDAVLSRMREATSLDPRFRRLDGIRRSPANCQPHDPSLHSSRVFECAAPAEGWAHGSYRARVAQRGGPYVLRTAFGSDDLSALTMVAEGGASSSWTVDAGALVAPGGIDRAWAVFGDTTWMHVHLSADVDPAGGVTGLAVAVGGTSDNEAVVVVVDAQASVLRLERRRAGTHEVVDEVDLPAVAGQMTLELIAYDDEVVGRTGDVEVRAPRRDAREGRIALVSSPGGRITRLSVQPIEAYAIDVTTSRWRTFEDHVAAHRDGAPIAIAATTTELAGWLAAEWDRITSAMAPEADPRLRGTVFRTALETLGIAAIESPRDPSLTRLLVDGASAAVLVEGPEPLPLSDDVSTTLQRRLSWPFPIPHLVPRDELVGFDHRRGGTPPDRPPPVPRPPRHHALGSRPSVISEQDQVPRRMQRLLWQDVPTLRLTDDGERRALVVPVDPASRTPLTLAGPILRIRFEIDRERYRSATADPGARNRASVVRSLRW
jgi:hypothetical protein